MKNIEDVPKHDIQAIPAKLHTTEILKFICDIKVEPIHFLDHSM